MCQVPACDCLVRLGDGVTYRCSIQMEKGERMWFDSVYVFAAVILSSPIYPIRLMCLNILNLPGSPVLN